MSEIEERVINNYYAKYLLNGGKVSKNAWIKRLVMDRLAQEEERK